MDPLKDNNIKCLQINLQRKRNAMSTLTQYIYDNKVDIILAQEPYELKGKVSGLPMFYKTIYDKTCDKPKSFVIIANSNINPIFIQSFSNDCITVVSIECNNTTIILISVYLTPSLTLQEFEVSINHLQQIIDSRSSHLFK